MEPVRKVPGLVHALVYHHVKKKTSLLLIIAIKNRLVLDFVQNAGALPIYCIHKRTIHSL